MFWYIKEAIDAYFAGGPFHVAVKAGCVVGKKLDHQAVDRPLARPLDRPLASGRAAEAVAARSRITAPIPTAASDTQEHARQGELETGLPSAPRAIARGSVRAQEPEQHDHTDIPELVSEELSLDEDPRSEQALDAFIDGKKRPHHLAD